MKFQVAASDWSRILALDNYTDVGPSWRSVRRTFKAVDTLKEENGESKFESMLVFFLPPGNLRIYIDEVKIFEVTPDPNDDSHILLGMESPDQIKIGCPGDPDKECIVINCPDDHNNIAARCGQYFDLALNPVVWPVSLPVYSSEIIVWNSNPDTDSDLDGIPDTEDNCPNSENIFQTDADGDGFGTICDCNDNNAAKYPADDDRDGYSACTDCNDDDAGINPDAAETCGNYIDENCDGIIAVCNPSDWYTDPGLPSGWEYRQQINISAGMTIANLPNFPVLVKITGLNNALFANAQTNGNDIVFTDYNGNKLAHEIDKYDLAAGILIAWVKMPVLTASGNSIYIYYGNGSAPNQQNKNAVWDSNYVMVHHLSETSGQHRDSTSNGYESYSVTAEQQGQTATAVIGGADYLTSSQKISIADPGVDSALDMVGNTPMTLSAWIRPSRFEGFQNGIITKNYTLRLDGPNMVGNCNADTALVGSRDGVWDGIGGSCGTINLNTWHHVVYVYEVVPGADNDVHYLYIDGQLDNSRTVRGGDITGTDSAGDLCIAYGWANCNFGSFWDGYVDEVRISNTARSAAWVQAEYNNQSSPENYIHLATQEVYCTDSDGDGYSADGGLCGVMDCNDSDANIYPGGPPVRVAGGNNYYLTLQGAYDAAADGSSIEIKAGTLAENLYFNLSKTLTITGGHDCGYSTVTGITTVNGNMTVSSGKVTIENMEIQ